MLRVKRRAPAYHPAVRNVERCLICGARELEPFAMASGPVLLHTAQVRCRGCGLLISQPQATEEELEHFYGRAFYEELWPDASAISNRDAYRRDELQVMRRLWADGPPGPGAEAIEVGCGYGEFLDVLRDEGLRARGCEVGEKAVAHCRAHGHEVLRGKWPGLPFPSESADLVVSLQVVEHVSDPRAFVRDLVALARPGGLVAIATEDAWTSQVAIERLARRLRGRIPEFRSPTDHTCVLEARHLRALLEEAGCAARTLSYTRPPQRENFHWRLYKGLCRAVDRATGHGEFLMAVGRRR
jgi:SAM-dependent methyltransferase